MGLLTPVSNTALGFGFVLNMVVVSEEVAGSLLCAFTKADTSAVSSIELKQGLRLNWCFFFFFFPKEKEIGFQLGKITPMVNWFQQVWSRQSLIADAWWWQ